MGASAEGIPVVRKLAIVRWVHSVVYLVMAGATLWVVYCGIVGRRDRSLAVAAGLVAFEGIIFFANRMRCPLTALAQRYGDPTGHVGDTLFPERCTRYTFRVFGTLYALGLLLVALRSI
jgi:hypothetical protein